MRDFRLNLLLSIYVIFVLKCLLRSSALKTNEYDGDERDALLKLRDSLKSLSNLHANWTGPPCYGNTSRWLGIGCSNWHVNTIVLDGIRLTGSLPKPSNLFRKIPFLTKLSLRNNSMHGPLPDLTGLSYIQYVIFSQNRFSGPIPTSYIRLPKLTKLQLEQNSLSGSIPPFNQTSLVAFNVSYNNLHGSIPWTKSLRKLSKSSFENNKNLCGQQLGVSCPKSPPPPESSPKGKNRKKLKVWVIELIASAATLVLLSIMVVFLYYRKRHQRREIEKRQQAKSSPPGRAGKKRYWEESMKDPERTVELEFFDQNRSLFDLDELLRASSEVLGKGKVGTTYKAMLETGAIVVAKRLRDMNSLSKREFLHHMEILGSIRHINLVEVVSFYYSKDEKLLISEFVPNGSLYDLLHENRGAARTPLNWNARISIIKEIAYSLDFLHQSFATHKVPHGNLKSSNVLIVRDRQNIHSKLSDYGLLPLMTSRRSTQRLAVARTPEFFEGRRLTHKSDVYCFGIILLEVITGKIPGDNSRGGSNKWLDDLSDWVKSVVDKDWSTDILDVEIVSARDEHNDMLRLTEIALECTDVVPERRPKMSDVLRKIQDMEYIQIFQSRI